MLVGNAIKKDEGFIGNDIIGDAQQLLQDASLAHMWKGGILTIGTFGFDPLKDQTSLDDYIDEYEDEPLEEDEEFKITGSDDDEEYEELINPLMYEKSHTTHNDEARVLSTTTKRIRESSEGGNKERITLADLFSADNSHDKNIPEVIKKDYHSKVKNNGLAFAKKLIPRGREDSRPIHKLQQLMTRVLKRKVHPDMETKNHNNSRVIAAATTMLTFESISLLNIQETTA